MKAVAINTSPEKDRGKISALLDPFLGGLEDSGAEIELYYSRDLLIFPCCGNMNCTVRTPGQCMAWDDLRWLRPKIGQADLLILASPLYFNGLTGTQGVTESLKYLQDRLAAAKQFSLEVPYEHAIHTTREQANLSKVVLVSGCGFWEISNFYPVLTHLKAFCYNTFPELPGCIYGPRETVIRGEFPDYASGVEVAEIAREAGRQTAMCCHKAAPVTKAIACDGGAGTPKRKQREWSSEILFQSSCM